jgi:beta-lactamase regulating signal transducer with metallopeptidase domain
MEWLLTWLWQGIALTLLVAIGLRLYSRIGASVRYAVWWAALAGVVALGWTSGAGSAQASAQIVGAASTPLRQLALELPSIPVWLISVLLAAWAVLMAVGFGRLSASLWTLREQRRSCEPIPIRRERRLPRWMSARDAARRARLMVSDTVPVASVLGLVRPFIVVPRHFLDQMTDQELDLVVLHEHAHVRRWDDWSRLAQTLIETLLPFHPAVRWIGRALVFEREVACDQWVVRQAGAPKTYAGCLARVAELTAGDPVGTLVPGIYRTGRALVRRIERLLGPQPYSGRAVRNMSLVAGLVVIAGAVLQFRTLPALFVERHAAVATSAQAVVTAVPVVSVSGRATGHDAAAGEPPSTPAATRAAQSRSTGSDRVPPSVPAPVEPVAEPLDATTTVAPVFGVSLPPALPAAVSAPDEPDPGADRVQQAAAGSQSPWQKTADAGVAIGTDAQQSGMAIASAFTRLGRSLGRAF